MHYVENNNVIILF